MITIEDYFWQSQLSEAAYANLSTDMFGEDDSEYIIALKNEGMSTEQARAFANKYTVVDQYTDPDSGFSGTVFQDTSGKVFIAMRGTQPSAVFTDWPTNIADIGSDGIAIDQGIAMYNWYQRLITPVGEEATQYIYHKEISFSGVIIQSAWLEETTVTVTSQGENEGGGLVGKSDIAVTGHSLGGHLAMIMSRIAPNLVTSTLTFNAPRFDTNLALDWSNIPFSHLTLSTTALTSEGFFDLLEDAEYQNLGSSQIGYEWATSEIINTRVEGDVVSLIGDLPGAGNQQQLFSESINEGPIDAHDMKAITDAFAVCQLLSQIDSNLTLNSITSILKASSNIGKFSLESVVSSLGGLFLSGFNKRTGSEYNSDRDQLYKDIKDITATLSNYPNQSIESFCTIDSEGNSIPFTASDINTLAQSNIAYRYALINLNPFAVIGMDYSEFNQDGELDVNTSSNPNGQLSDQYLQDRANFLVQLLHENIYDTGAKNPYAPINIDVYPNLADYYYADLTTGNQSLNAMYSDLATKKDQHQQFIFGSSSNDTIKGGSKDDHLYGMHGQDTLDGGSGNDTFFVMGEDEDYDIFIGGDDEDTIKGSAGNDTIRLHEFFGEKTVEFINGGGGEDIIAGTDLNDTIDLSDTTLIGIKHIEGGDKVDTITGSAGDDTIYGGAGGDILNGGLGDDTIYGEDDKDTLSGGGGVNHLHGGSGLDIYIVGAAAAEIGETDYISDEDNDGIIRLGDGTVLGGVWEQIAEGRYRHEGTGLEGTIGGGRFTIELSSNKTAIIENWEDGRFGITLREPEAEPEVPEPGSYTAVGDYEWKVFYDNDGDPYYDRDEWGNYILDYEAPAPDKEDTLYDTPDNDELYGYGGVDWLYAYRGGNDIVDGGAGDDWIEKGGGWGILIGGEGSDAVFGDTGNDILYADIRMTVEEIHEAYADGTGTGARGDLLSGQEGDDTLYGWHGDDILAGGIGNDTIYGGAGNDTIEGDAHMGWWYALDPWEVTWEIEPGDVTIYRRTYGGGITWSWGDSADHGNDIIDAGAGDDWIFAGGGNDIVDAGTGNDVVFGEEGNDTIIGGAGEDTINGDSGGDSIPGNMHGVDWIFGGDDKEVAPEIWTSR
ncbi:MAG: hypothetical protein KQH59_19705 [Desulfobulbaceae bacterium]|nr:hypothetical protein [Desulfobulbaceae bacterium]